jgi:hypothetical protein
MDHLGGILADSTPSANFRGCNALRTVQNNYRNVITEILFTRHC